MVIGTSRLRVVSLRSLLVAAAGAVAVACGGSPAPKEPLVQETVSDAGADDAAAAEPPKPKSLYERLGGKDAIAQVVDSFMKNVTSNDVTKKRFAKMPKDKAEKFRGDVANVICRESGGDCSPDKEPKTAFKGMKITEPEWNAAVTALKAAMDEQNIADTEQGDLIALLAPMKDDIVEVKPKGAAAKK